MKDNLDISRTYSIIGSSKTKSTIEKIMHLIFMICGLVAVVAVFGITIYMFIAGGPAIGKIGIKDFLFSSVWDPTNATNPQFGILNIIYTSIVGTIFSIIIGVPIALFTAIFLSEFAPKALYRIVRPAVELLAGIPSIIYGLVGAMVLVPFIGKIEMLIFAGQEATHKFTGGSSLIAAIIVLAIMILPTIVNVSETALKAVPKEYKEASLALGASHTQTIFKVLLLGAKSGIATSIVLGVGRAIGEAMAIIMVAGNIANIPTPFNSVKFLTTAIASDFGYAGGLHRQTLFSIGLVLFIFIMIINICLNTILKGKNKD